MKLVVKVGGAQLEEPRSRAALARSVARARASGHELALVHGGGNQIREVVRRIGLSERYHEGLRVTDAETADVVVMVLAGLVNKELVAALVDAGVRAVGISGADGASFSVERSSVDLGYVGRVARTEPALVATLLEGGFLPVIATVAPLASGANGPRHQFYNINADLAAGPLAQALEADGLLFLTDVPAVHDAAQRRVGQLSRASARELRAAGALAGGMIPKVEAGLAALAELPSGLIKIAPAAGENAILAALEDSVGTRFVPEN